MLGFCSKRAERLFFYRWSISLKPINYQVNIVRVNTDLFEYFFVFIDW